MISMYHVCGAALTFNMWPLFPLILLMYFLKHQFKRQCNLPPGVRTTALWAPLVRSVTRGASVRTEPSVTISTEPVCVKQGLKALIAKKDSVPKASTASSVTSTAPVIPPTPWGKWDVSARPHTASLRPSPEAKPPRSSLWILLQLNIASSSL